jgi:hypothetical protein
MILIHELKARDRQISRIQGGADSLEGPQRPASFQEERRDSLLPMNGQQERL